jgi:hypothetical protein
VEQTNERLSGPSKTLLEAVVAEEAENVLLRVGPASLWDRNGGRDAALADQKVTGSCHDRFGSVPHDGRHRRPINTIGPF